MFPAFNLAASYALSTRIPLAHVLAIERLRKSNRKMIFADAARPSHQKRLANSIFSYRALQQLLYSFISDER